MRGLAERDSLQKIVDERLTRKLNREDTERKARKERVELGEADRRRRHQDALERARRLLLAKQTGFQTAAGRADVAYGTAATASREWQLRGAELERKAQAALAVAAQQEDAYNARESAASDAAGFQRSPTKPTPARQYSRQQSTTLGDHADSASATRLNAEVATQQARRSEQAAADDARRRDEEAELRRRVEQSRLQRQHDEAEQQERLQRERAEELVRQQIAQEEQAKQAHE